MNKYNLKKEVTEHVAGMVVTEPESGGGGNSPQFPAAVSLSSIPCHVVRDGDDVMAYIFLSDFMPAGIFARIQGEYYAMDGGVSVHVESIENGPMNMSVPILKYKVAGTPCVVIANSADFSYVERNHGGDGLPYTPETMDEYKDTGDNGWDMVFRVVILPVLIPTDRDLNEWIFPS